MGAKMRRGFRNVCNNDDSTSTLNQQHNPCYKHEPTISSSSSQLAPPSSSNSYMENEHFTLDDQAPPRKSVTLEEMILQLELEEEIARKEKAKNTFECRRMSCVNNSDILRSARNAALNQYPRFSLDGRDSLYRSSFRNNNNNTNHSFDGLKLGRLLHLPQCLGGESVVWCKPGVVPKLMGLEAMPVPVRRFNNNNVNNIKDQKPYNNIRMNHNLRRRAQINEFERRQRRHYGDYIDTNNYVKRSGRNIDGGSGSGSKCCTSTSGYCLMNPIALEPVLGLGGSISWPNQYHYT